MPDTGRYVERHRRIVFDGLNLPLKRGTGIATYARVLTGLAAELGYDVGVVYSSPFTPARDARLREILLLDERGAADRLGTKTTPRRVLNSIVDQVRYHFPVKPLLIDFTGAVIDQEFADFLPHQDRAYVARNLFKNANSFYKRTKRLVELSLDPHPEIFHCTYTVPLHVKSACNIYTIHDLVPLRMPFTTMDNKRQMYALLKNIVAQADHIITVSEASKRDIVELLGVESDRVTNTYQAITLPEEYLVRPETTVANFIDAAFGLTPSQYLLFFGSIEPKKNVGRLIEAYFSSGIDTPLVIVMSPGWQNEAELALLRHHYAASEARVGNRRGPSLRCFEHLGRSALINLIRGARAVLFPSLYEGFGLPVLEAMTLGAPVVTSRAGSLPEIAGDAALLVDPYDVDEIARAIKTIDSDADLRRELSRRGRERAEFFSLDRYRERVRAVYASAG